MKLEIQEIEYLTGKMAHVYSVALEGEDKTLLEQFFEDNAKYKKDIKKVVNKIRVMADDSGCRKIYLKEGEGAWADGMIALKNTGNLRLYGIFFHNAAILLGSGGYKPPGIIAYEDHPPLNKKAQLMKKVAKEIYRMIRDKEIKIYEDGTIDVY